MSIPITPTCVCGCNGSRLTNQCQYTNQGRDTTEQDCSAGGQVTGIDDLVQIWSTFPCKEIYSDILFTSSQGVREYNPCNLARVQANIDHLLTQYTTAYGFDFTSNTSSPKYDSFQSTLIDLCNSPIVPGGCNLFLTNYCGQRTRQEIESDSALADMCGCYAPPQYPTQTLAPECDPICHLVNTSQQAQPCSGEITSCSNTVCVLSDININLVDSSVVPAFQQICPSCSNPAMPCTCIISGVNIVGTLDDAGVGAQYLQYCGKNSQCYKSDPNGTLTQIACPTNNDFNPTNHNPMNIFWIMIIILAIFLFFIFIIIIARYWRPHVTIRGV